MNKDIGGNKGVATNKQAFRDYDILERLECGIELKGSEVKSIRDGRVNFEESFARINEKDEVILYNTHISSYAQASYLNVEPTRPRKLLLHRNQIRKLFAQISQRGLTLIPLKIYFNSRGYAKVEIALCKGKKLYDRRDDIKRREADLKIRRILRNKG
jgi:SsrA-binding protein